MTKENQSIFVNTRELVELSEYVCWIDIMGTRATMAISLQRAANHIIRLHDSIIHALNGHLKFYPMLDGAYITADSKSSLENFLKLVFEKLAKEFIQQEDEINRFIPKASVSFGPIVHGGAITDDVNKAVSRHETIKRSLLFGIPVISANEGEKKAPPFGIYIDNSARMFGPKPGDRFPFVWYNWAKKGSEIASQISTSMEEYYAWCKKNQNTITYSIDRIDVHSAMAKEYFQPKS